MFQKWVVNIGNDKTHSNEWVFIWWTLRSLFRTFLENYFSFMMTGVLNFHILQRVLSPMSCVMKFATFFLDVGRPLKTPVIGDSIISNLEISSSIKESGRIAHHSIYIYLNFQLMRSSNLEPFHYPCEEE